MAASPSLAVPFMSQHRHWPEVGEWTRLRRVVVEASMRPDFERLRAAINYFRSNL